MDFPLSQMAFAPRGPGLSTQQVESGDGHYQKGKLFADPIYGPFRVDPICVSIIDTPQFQRLRNLKQLGTSYQVFSGASHNRFEHSVGVCHLAEDVVTRFHHMQPELEIEKRDVDAVRIAGLVHDLGHGPFSHVFDNELIPRICAGRATPFSHEDMSEKLFYYLLDDNNIDLDADLAKTVCSMVMASSHHDRRPTDGRGYLYDIVANGRNGIDVDKVDYLQRDAYNCGLKASCSFDRLPLFMRVIDGEIAFKASEVDNIYELFNTRVNLYHRVYLHRKAKALEFMLVDALVAAEPVLKLGDKIDDPREFVQLDDSIVSRIEWSTAPELAAARAIVRRIRTRALYRYVNELVVPPEWCREYRDVTPVMISTCAPNGGLVPEDIIVHNYKVDFGQKLVNPVDSTFFFQDWRSADRFHIPRHKVSTLLPSTFMERKVRVYARDEAKVEAIGAAFEAYQRKTFGPMMQVHSTPSRGGARKRLHTATEEAPP